MRAGVGDMAESAVSKTPLASDTVKVPDDDGAKFRVLADRLNVGILVHRNFQPLYANQAFADLFGFDGPSDVLAFDGTDGLFTKESREVFRQRHLARLRGEEPQADYILHARRLDGSFIWVNNRPALIDWMGEPAICTTLADVTERVLAEDALKESELQHRRLFENAGEGLFRMIPEGRYVDANPTLADILGYDSPVDLMDSINDVETQIYVDPKDHAKLSARLEKTDRLERQELRWRRKDGSVIWVMVSLRAIRDLDGVARFFEGAAIDITAWRATEFNLIRAKEEAELANRAKSEFLAHMSHELRTPLNCIIGFSQILMGEMFGALGHRNYVEYVGDIHTSGLHLLNVISDILDISKIEAGELNISESVVDVAETLLACMKMMRERADRAQLILSTEISPTIPKLLADELRLKQILLNLLSNAVKYTPPGGRISVRTSVNAAGNMEFVVADTGIGIAEEDMSRVLMPFEQVRESQNLAKEGTGLGVYLSRVLAELHGGTLSIESVPRKGTTVVVNLPAARLIGDKNEAV